MNILLDFLLNYKSQIAVFFIFYFPTILFCVTIILSIIISVLRGSRKTRIAITHSVICFIICLILFIALVEDKNVDAFLLRVVNTFLGEGGMQRLFGVSESCTTFRDIFIEYLPNQLNYVDGIALVARDNGMYLSSLVDVLYRFTFGIVLYLLYWVLRFIMWIISLIFYPERRYIRRRNRNYENGLVDTPYRKNRGISALLGASKGLVSALVSISFLGMFFYIIAGGTGDGSNREKMNINNPTVDFAVDVYSELESYGTQGIFKVLNAVRDEKNMPYYLFAANMIFQGKVVDDGEISKVYYIDELADYVNFSRNTFDLFLKYDKDNIVGMINQDVQINILDEVINVFKNEDFQNEFESLIVNFESKSYFVNLTYSLVDSLSAHLSDVQFTKNIPDEILVPLKILFEEGYLCDEIPYEKDLMNEKVLNESSDDFDESKYVLDYIKPSKLLNKDDIINIYNIFIKFITKMYSTAVDINLVIDTLVESMPYIKNLSILNGNRKNELDGVLTRLYAYIENKYLGGESEIVTSEEINYSSGSYSYISWVEELSMLVDILDLGLDLYDNYFRDSNDIYGAIINLIDHSNESKINDLLNIISSSRILGNLLGTRLFVDLYNNNVTSSISNISFPEGVSFGNTYDEYGHFESYGELYYLFKSLSLMINNPNTIEFLMDIRDNTLTSGGTISLFNKLSKLVNYEIENETLAETMTNSRMLNSIISAFIISNKNINESVSIFIDDSILEKNKNGETLNIITKEELSKLLSEIDLFIEIAEPFIEGREFKTEDLMALIKDDRLLTLLDSKIIEGTISYILANNSTDMIIIPESMKNGEGLVSTESHTSEIRKIIQLVNDLDLDLNIFTDTTTDDTNLQQYLMDLFMNLDSAGIDSLLESNIFYYTISNFLNEQGDSINASLHIIVPSIANEMLINDSISYVIKKEVLREFINDVQVILSTESLNPLDILTNIIKNKYVMDNMIISVTVANMLSNEISSLGGLNDFLAIPEKYNSSNYGNKTELKEDFSRTNPWFLEAKALVNALDLLLDLDDNETINTDDLTEKIIAQINTLNDSVAGTSETKLDRLYNSEIFVRTLSKRLDAELSNFIDSEVLASAKKYGGDDYKKSEIRALVNVFKIFDLSIDSDNIQDSIMDGLTSNIWDYTVKEYENGTKSKLDLLYESFIVKELFTSTISKILKEQTNSEDLSSLELCYDENGYFKQGEIESLLMLFEILEIDDLENISIDKVLNNINNIRLDDINKLYRYNITAVLLASGLTQSGISVSDEAKIKKNNKVYEALNINEAKALVYALNTFDIDLNNLSIDEINLNDIEIDTLSKSTIVSNLIYTNIKSTDIVIPKAVVVSNSYIKLSEFESFLNAIYDNKDDLFSNGNISFDSMSIDPEDISIDTLIRLCDSKIMQANLAVNIVSNLKDVLSGSKDSSLFKRYIDSGTKEKMEEEYYNIWIRNNEMKMLIEALDSLDIQIYSILENDIDFNEILNPERLNEKYHNTDKTKFDKCYESDLMKCILSKNIYDHIDETIVDKSIKDYKYKLDLEYYEKSEIQGIINALSILGLDYDSLNSDNFDVDLLKDKYDNPRLYDSYIVRGILTKAIDDLLGDLEMMACDLCYDEYVRVYKQSEIMSLFELVASSPSVFEYDVSSIDINTVKNLIYSDNETKSYIIVTTFSNSILSQSDIIIPLDSYDKNNNIIKPRHLREFIDAIEKFGMDINGVEFEMESDISIPELSNDDLDIVCKSDIFRATISLKLVINDSNVMVENDTNYVSFCKKDKDNKYINIISSTELSNIIKIVNRYCGGSSIENISFNETQLFADIISNSETKDLLLSSSAIRVIIGAYSQTGTYSLLVETKEVAVLSHHDISREGAAIEAGVLKLN